MTEHQAYLVVGYLIEEEKLVIRKRKFASGKELLDCCRGAGSNKDWNFCPVCGRKVWFEVVKYLVEDEKFHNFDVVNTGTESSCCIVGKKLSFTDGGGVKVPVDLLEECVGQQEDLKKELKDTLQSYTEWDGENFGTWLVLYE